MPRVARIAPAGVVFHVLNRANAQARIFEAPADYVAFERVLREACDRVPMRILAYCVMPTHWHLVVWPRRDGDLGTFMQRATTTHVRRWHLNRDSVGMGHLYQGTYRSFPIQKDSHFLSVVRYVERNALRARLVQRAEDWRWCSLWLRVNPTISEEKPPLHPWPVQPPDNWIALVNEPQTLEELETLRVSLNRGRPFGNETWQQEVAKQLRLESTFRTRGRPRKRKRG